MQDFAATNYVLQSELGFPEGNLFEGISLESANRLWLSRSFGKKFVPNESVERSANQACLELFKDNNFRCASLSLQPRDDKENLVIEGVKALFDDLVFCGPETYIERDAITSRFMTGPGAAQLALADDFYSKLFAGPLSCTSNLLYRVYRDCLSSSPRWLASELLRSATFGERQVVGNRLSFAPKTAVISRAICTEPSLNMLFQKGIGSCIESGLRRIFKIDLSCQPDINKGLARIGSIDGTFGTIDLSSASDSISESVLYELIPLQLKKWLALTRSATVIFPDGSSSPLYMVSSMGNGFTFPLQTYLFSSIVVSAYRALGIKPSYDKVKPTNFGVFGDDIIVLKDAYDFVIRCLELFGFTVNAEKSFNSGGFRESCGGDYLRGHEIRGVYVRSLSNDAEVYSVINRLVRWSSRTGILLPKTIAYLRGFLKGKTFWIPPKDGDAEGIKVPTPPISVGWHPRLQCFKYEALTKRSVSYRVPNSAEDTSYYPFKNGKRTKVFFNPDGVIVSVVAGFIRCERISLRTRKETFKIRKRTTSSWSGFVTPPDASLWLQGLNRLDQGFRPLKHTLYTGGSHTVGSFFSPGDDWKVVAGLLFGE